MDNPRILIAAGGTGGHVYPAIAIADAIKHQNADSEILFVGTKDHMEWKAVPKAGYKIKSVWISGFHRRLTLKNMLFPLKLVTSIVQSFGIVSSFKPQVMVSCGGYAAGPVGWVAGKRGVKIVIQEQNSFPGVTNRMLAKFASKIFTAFKEAAKYLPSDKIVESGNPTRNTLDKVEKEVGLRSFDFDDSKPVLMVLGGSGGAKTINEAIKGNLDKLSDLQVIWQCGSRYIDALMKEVDLESNKNIRLTAFIDNMPEAYAASDLIVSRAGASSCSEFMMTGKPSVLIPSPNVAGDHQTQNAQSMVDAGASELLKDADAVNALPELVHSLIRDQEKLKEMNKAALRLAKPDAAKMIAKEILELAKSKNS
ncbi:MAG TPA: undecaprenyldiphospho-muramoylpentapeptide beta-N-acetylglucosaminyltransferase [Balneola sp.]|jgi:UDP-N-acetylglucosamine--N-acetylmuramyl-(pentapeptide) pyrophosphoryl-undecaprenol N-acetylglucosamine transferase|nr:undecaprenyldiphospho-muramoylpentapeptide beta-N-acetylglucosaminyltransferase [Balneola sp.]MAO78697.1 undecaprenyldiphospho-muramoylpentapeptide beta-N-acetylglucosaminyltransferase [Balneola sp.]MBF64788.1 undecaprenyldiphospho-muramoylpentapeptide beta-N-acetylglucosaminyltransferase [Balneola sp.]HBZ38992.1 undecaprenyldiphospho-muramoylpentapeptide beta-N-acetylglucosaminyltransferase [Balneola sp.]HCT53067.1 undecaprenyldiphospho-muramoylpentapeptide beta-N-acetylglucosaminyltransfer|tara:strand:- start:73 stop:1173 length:1101 start_codon:yes stop_codon:yes gene_type:complete